MKKWTKLLSLALTSFLMVGIAASIKQVIRSVNAETETYQHVFNAKPNTGDSIDLSGVNWKIEATNLNSYNSANYAGVQVGAGGKDGLLKLSSTSAWNYKETTIISEIRLWLNNGGGIVTPTVKIGGESAISDGSTVEKNSTAGKDWTKASKVTFTPADGFDGGMIEISIATSSKAGYICCLEIDSCVQASVNSKTITYNLNCDDATNNSSNPKFYEPGTGVAELLAPSRPGYTFTGWTLHDQVVSSISTEETEDIELVATWEPIHVNGIILSKNNAIYEAGDMFVLSATVSPSEALNKNCIWSSEDDEIATVNQSGEVTCLSVGETMITVTTEDGNFSASCSLEVTKGPDFIWDVLNWGDYESGKDIATQDLDSVVSISNVGHATTHTRYWTDGIRCYKSGGYIEFCVASGYKLDKIKFVGSCQFTVNVGNFSDSTWTPGKEEIQTVKFSATSTTGITFVKFYYSEYDANTYNIFFDGNNGVFKANCGENIVTPIGESATFNLPTISDFASYPEEWAELKGWKIGNQTYNPGSEVTLSSSTTITAVWGGANISISKSLEIAAEVGENKTLFEYSTTGYLKSILNSNNLIITDGVDEIQVYVYNSLGSRYVPGINQELKVTGKITTYKETNTKEYTGASLDIINTPAYHKVSFNLNGGDGLGDYSTQYILENNKAIKPADPEIENYQFDGWYIDDKQWDFNSVVENDLNLIARWSEKSIDIITSSQLNIKYKYNEKTLMNVPEIVDGNSYYISFIQDEIKYYLGDVVKNYITYSDDFNNAKLFTFTAKDNGFTIKSNGSFIGDQDKTSFSTSESVWNIVNSEGKFSISGAKRKWSTYTDNSDIRNYATSTTVFELEQFGPISISKIDNYALRFSCEFNNATITQNFKNLSNWKCGFMVAQNTQMAMSFEEAYNAKKDQVTNFDESYIQNIANLAMKERMNSKISWYADTMDKLPEAVDGMYEFSVNVAIPDTNLDSVVSAVWFAYNTGTHEIVFASQKDMSIMEIAEIYDDMKLTESQNAAIDYILALANN